MYNLKNVQLKKRNNLKNVKQHNAVIDKIEIRKNALIVNCK